MRTRRSRDSSNSGPPFHDEPGPDLFASFDTVWASDSERPGVIRALADRVRGMRACHTNNCPVGIATQKDHLRQRLVVAASAQRLINYFNATVHRMQVLARACGHDHLNRFSPCDLTTWKRDMAYLTGVSYAGMVPLD